MTHEILRIAQNALDIDKPNHQVTPVKFGLLNGRKIATIALLGVTTGLAVAAAATAIVFASTPLAIAAGTFAIVSAIEIAIVARTDISKEAFHLIKSLYQKIKEIFEKNQKLSQELETLKNSPAPIVSLESDTKRIQELEKQVDELNREKQQSTTLPLTTDAFEQQIQDQKNEIEKLKKEIDENTSNKIQFLDDLNNQNASFADIVSDLELKIKDLEQKLEEVSIQTVNKKELVTHNKFTNQVDIDADASGLTENLKETIKAQKIEIDQLKSKLTNFESTVFTKTKIEETKKLLETKNNLLEETKNELKDKYSSLEKKYKKLQGYMAKLDKLIDQLPIKIAEKFNDEESKKLILQSAKNYLEESKNSAAPVKEPTSTNK